MAKTILVVDDSATLRQVKSPSTTKPITPGTAGIAGYIQ